MSFRTVAYSERLGQLTDNERRVESLPGVRIDRVPLWTEDDIRNHGAEATALVVGAVEPLDRAALSLLTECRVISRRGVGLNNIDVSTATDLGIPVAFVPAASVHEVSDHALALIFDLERRISSLDQLVKSGVWKKGDNRLPDARVGVRRLAGLTLGVIGFGRIGRELARKAAPSFGEVIAYDPLVAPESLEDGIRAVTLGDLLDRSDVISLHAPLTPETAHIIDERALARVKPGTTIVNTSRGGLIDTDALVRALQDGRVGRAGLDVTEVEPLPSDSPLLTVENVLLTGHSAASSLDADAELRSTTIDAVIDVLQQGRPQFLANPEVLDRPNCRI